MEGEKYWSDSETLDGNKGIRDQVQWYVDHLRHYAEHIDNYDPAKQEKIPYLGHGETDLEGAKFQYSFWFEAMIWFIQSEVKKK